MALKSITYFVQFSKKAQNKIRNLQHISEGYEARDVTGCLFRTSNQGRFWVWATWVQAYNRHISGAGKADKIPENISITHVTKVWRKSWRMYI